MIGFNNGVTNIDSTPGIIANTTANQPAAASVAEGTLYIQTDGNKFQRSSGGAWVDVGGGGSTPGIDTVLAQLQNLTQFRIIELDSQQLSITQSGIPVFSVDEDTVIMGLNFGGLYPTLTVENATGSYSIYSNYQGTTKGIFLDFINFDYRLGDEDYFLDVDANNLLIRTFTDAAKYGAEFTKDTVKIGDYDNAFNKVQIFIDDPNQTIVHDTNGGENQFNGNVIAFNGGVLSGTASGSSGQHLEIYVNGNPYKIALLNP